MADTPCIVSIDGGGSKTEVYQHTPVKRFLTGFYSLNIHNSGVENVWELVRGLRNLFGDCLYIFGVAGLDSELDWSIWREFLNSLRIRYILLHDVEQALYAAEPSGEGLIVISGTGSNVYGVYRGRSVKLGNWGWRFGDDFSGYRLGARLINRFLKAFDGRAGDRELRRYMEKRLGPDPIAKLYTLPVFKVAEIGVGACIDRVDEAWELARELAYEAAYTAYRASKILGYNSPVHYTGGLFRCRFYRNCFKRFIRELGLEVGRYVEHPVVGGLVPAAKQLGIDPMEMMREAEVYIKSVTEHRR